MKKAIIGAGGFGKEVFFSLSPRERVECKFFVDDEYYKKGAENTIPLSKFDVNEYEIVVAVGDPLLRQKIVGSLPTETKYFTHIHSTALILSNDVQIGEGSIICAGSIITTNVVIGKHAHLNLQTTIGHDCEIGDYFTTAPGAKISGNCSIGNRVYFGTNASVRQKTIICDDVTIGSNATVVKNIISCGKYVGVPVKKI